MEELRYPETLAGAKVIGSQAGITKHLGYGGAALAFNLQGEEFLKGTHGYDSGSGNQTEVGELGAQMLRSGHLALTWAPLRLDN